MALQLLTFSRHGRGLAQALGVEQLQMAENPGQDARPLGDQLFFRVGSAVPQGLPSGPMPDSVNTCGNMTGPNLPHSAVSSPLSRGTKLVAYHSRNCTSNSVEA